MKTQIKKWNRAEFITKWIKALKSGKYEQTTGRLKKQNAYCCLGLASSIMGEQYGAGKFVKLFQSEKFECSNGEQEGSVLPSPVACKLKTDDQGYVAVSRKNYIMLTDLNDCGINFLGIAAVLENYPLVKANSSREILSVDPNDIGDDLNDDKRDLKERLNFIFRKTKYAKSWRRYCINKGSKIDKEI